MGVEEQLKHQETVLKIIDDYCVKVCTIKKPITANGIVTELLSRGYDIVLIKKEKH